YPALAEAYRFFSTATPLARAEVEARLLAGQDDGGVAARCGLSPVAVRWYHALFFAVRPCRRATHYVLNVVLGPKVHAGLSEKDSELLLKWFGFRYGAAAVDDLLRYF